MLSRRWRTALVLGLCLVTVLSIGAWTASVLVQVKPSAGAVEPDWVLEWVAPSQSAKLSPREALIAGAHARHLTDNSVHSPAHITLVMEGPTIARAVVQLDSAGLFGSLVTVTRQGPSAPWIAETGSLAYITHSLPCPQTHPAPAEYSFLGDICDGVGEMHSTAESYLTWTASNKRQFLAFRVNANVQPPATGSAEVYISSNTGWMVQDGAVTSVVVPLGVQEAFSLVAIGPGNVQQVEIAGAQVLDRLQLLGSSPISPPH